MALKIENAPQSAPVVPFSKPLFYYHALGSAVRPKLAEQSLIVERSACICLKAGTGSALWRN
jgi:hypothetical protein